MIQNSVKHTPPQIRAALCMQATAACIIDYTTPDARSEGSQLTLPEKHVVRPGRVYVSEPLQRSAITKLAVALYPPPKMDTILI